MTTALEAPGPSTGSAVKNWVNQRVLDELGTSESTSKNKFDRVARLAQQLFGVRSVSLRLFPHTQTWARATGVWSDAEVDIDPFEAAERSESGILMVTDASEDPRFWDSPLVTDDPGVIFFASVPINDSGGQRVGALQLSDPNTRVLTGAEQLLLGEVAAWVQAEVIALEELESAAKVQRGLAPKPFTAVAGYDVAGACSPAHAVGGDFYDWYPTPEGAAFTLADVMGKGVGAAIIAATVRAVMRSSARDDGLRRGLDSAAIALESDLDEASVFVTMFHARLTATTGRVRYIDAGHGLTVVISADLQYRRLPSTDLPLGIQPLGTWTKHEFVLEPGDTLVSVSDGVLDSFGGSLVALEELGSIVVDTSTAQEAVDEILRRSAEDALDDVTAVVIRREP